MSETVAAEAMSLNPDAVEAARQKHYGVVVGERQRDRQTRAIEDIVRAYLVVSAYPVVVCREGED